MSCDIKVSGPLGILHSVTLRMSLLIMTEPPRRPQKRIILRPGILTTQAAWGFPRYRILIQVRMIQERTKMRKKKTQKNKKAKKPTREKCCRNNVWPGK